jgi:cell division protein FtsL
MASTAAEIATNNHSGSSRTPRVRVVKGGRYGLSKARQFARTAGTVLVIAIFFGLFASIVASQARITQLSGEIDDAKSELTNAQSYNDYLSTTMDQITNSTSVQQEAEDRLGLVKMDPSQVRLEDESVIERAAGTADKFFAGIKTAALSLLGSFDP